MPEQPEPISLPSLKFGDIGTMSAQSLLNELESRFPEESPNRNESMEDLMWRGGQRSVVNWIRQRIEYD